MYTQKWDDVFAIVFMSILPVTIFYLFMQRYFISGVTAGAFKA
jgi:raffinose/stachyose/melibiose transport system permease protein